jgi:hypothetical protein
MMRRVFHLEPASLRDYLFPFLARLGDHHLASIPESLRYFGLRSACPEAAYNIGGATSGYGRKRHQDDRD